MFSPIVQSWGYLFLLLQRGNECRFIELFGRGKDNKLKTKSKVKLYLWDSPCMNFQGSDPRKRPRWRSPIHFLHRAKAPAGDLSALTFVLSDTFTDSLLLQLGSFLLQLKKKKKTALCSPFSVAYIEKQTKINTEHWDLAFLAPEGHVGEKGSSNYVNIWSRASH